ncbi:hypothetical protein FJ957_30320 [Mesorhizobium sp. B2-4-6]|nr:hypothetical protein FJ957_30320 [Mesorhizobium sp. B2-4-6]
MAGTDALRKAPLIRPLRGHLLPGGEKSLAPTLSISSPLGERSDCPGLPFAIRSAIRVRGHRRAGSTFSRCGKRGPSEARSDEGRSRERRRLTPLEHPSSVSALRADPPSPARGEGEAQP